MSEHYFRDCEDEDELLSWARHYKELGYATYEKGLRLYYFMPSINYGA